MDMALINFLKAKKYFELAAQLNNSSALYYLGYLCSTDIEFWFNISKAIKYLHKCIKIHKETCIIPDYVSNFYVNIKIYNRYYYHSNNYLGLIYLTYYNDIEKANEYIKEAAFGEYAYGQNNYGLFNQFYFDNIENAKHFFEKASKNQFALADYNLGYIYEKENKIEKSIVHYIKASNNEDNQLMYQKYHYNDKYFEASKTFIICFTNLKLCEYYFLQSKYDESRKYFNKAFSKLISNNYQFCFQLFNDSDEIFSYIRFFILQSPLFDLINDSDINTTYFFTNKHVERRINSKDNFVLKKSIYNPSKDQDIKIDKKCFIFNDPVELFDCIKANTIFQKQFLKEIKIILNIMKNILYTPPYLILHGRINYKKEMNDNSVLQNIDKYFYEGFHIDE